MNLPRPVVEAENRLDRFNADRDRIVADVERRVVEARLAAAAAGGDASLEYVLNEVAYSEMRRLEGSKDRNTQRKFQQWHDLANQLGRMSDDEKRERLGALVRSYALDIVGNFNPRVYRFSNNVLPTVFSFLFSPIRGVREGVAALASLGGRIKVEGPLDVVRDACERGTLVVVPTHSSNLDSVAVGFSLGRVNLPPVTYGAGVNLFTNPFLSFFMHNLGAYRVDRRLRFQLYKDILKEYSTVLLESGYHSLFFPGGTRSRSNQIEEHLKLGLLGTAISAYQNNVAAGAPYRRIYIVPLTINYRLVLEAETLIDDYLAETGKSRYIIEDDESSQFGRIVEFLRKTLAHEGSLVLRIGMPLDPFGNPTDEDGNSLDHRGRVIDPARYVLGRDGEVQRDPQRDAEYTRVLGHSLAAAYRRETVFRSTALVARALFDGIARRAGSRDIYRLLRVRAYRLVVPVDEVVESVDRLRARIVADPALGRLKKSMGEVSAAQLVNDAMKAFQSYHTHLVAERVEDKVQVRSLKLLFYYHNRTSHIPVEDA